VIPVPTRIDLTLITKQSVEQIERERDEDFERHNTIDLIVTE
jgi:hypothetical protein